MIFSLIPFAFALLSFPVQFFYCSLLFFPMLQLIGIPTTSNFGLIFKDKFEQMRMPAADLTLIININSALSMSLGFINGPLLRRFGYRSISVIAAVLFSLGLILTAMVDSVIGFIITYGVITGNLLYTRQLHFAIAKRKLFLSFSSLLLRVVTFVIDERISSEQSKVPTIDMRVRYLVYAILKCMRRILKFMFLFHCFFQ